MSTLDAVNDTFHDAYAAARRRRQADAPIFVLLADELVVRRGRERHAHRVRPPAFHTIKSVSHAPVALYALVRAGAAKTDEVARLERWLDGAADELGTLGDDARRDCEEALRRTRTAVGGVREGAIDLDAFARPTGPLLRKLTVHATRLHLDALDACVNRELVEMTDDERTGLQVVVTGDHQARSRSLGMQYFAKRLPRGSAEGERVIYAEGITDEEEAVALVALQRLDREVAMAFFGDPERLQSDVLGGAAEELLADGHYAEIGASAPSRR